MKKSAKAIICISILALLSEGVFAESLFQAGISQAVYPMQPKSLFGTVRAKTIGDIITVIIDENATTSNNVKLNIADTSTMADNFTSTINNIFSSDDRGTRVDLPNLDGFGGTSSTKNQAQIDRSIALSDTMTAQVVQVLPNGNLVIQGKKVAINSGEKTQIILSGIIDPRFITNAGTVESQYIANLQLAIVGNGTTSRHDSESLMNRIFGYIF